MQTGWSTLGCGGVLFFKALVLILGFFFLCVFMDCQKKRRFLGVMGGGGVEVGCRAGLGPELVLAQYVGCG